MVAYRKIAALLAERAEAEARLERARNESAAADELVGQMLARMGDVEARLRASQGATAEAEARAAAAEGRATEHLAQVGKLRAAQVELAERLGALEARLEDEQRDAATLRSGLEASERETEAHRAEAEAAREQVAAGAAQIQALRAELGRGGEERERLRARVAELERLKEERDDAQLREELLEIHLATARTEVQKARKHALSGQHRLGNELRDRMTQIDKLGEEMAQAVAKGHALEKELAAQTREAEAQRAAADAARGALASSDRRARDLEGVLAAVRREAAALEKEVASLRAERDALAAREGEADARAEAMRVELAAKGPEGEAMRAKLSAFELEREVNDGLAAETRRVQDAEMKRLRDEAAEALARGAEAMAMAEQFRSEMRAARRERDALAVDAQRARRGLEALKTRTDAVRAEFRASVEGVSKSLSDLEKREVEVARLRAGAIGATRDLLDHAVSVEHSLSGMLKELEDAPHEREQS